MRARASVTRINTRTLILRYRVIRIYAISASDNARRLGYIFIPGTYNSALLTRE